MTQDYIFGYGSLIETESRTRTTPEAKSAKPAVVTGVRRGWWDQTPGIGYSTTYLGADREAKAVCNGVVYCVSPDQLKQTDERESGYERAPIEATEIKMLDGTCPDVDGKYWIYLSQEKKAPTASCPIVQSYVDICVNGCIEIEACFPQAREAGYVAEFLDSTTWWCEFWVNDRLYPRRAFIYCPNASQIDRLIQEHHPELFAGIQLEPASR